MKQTRQTTQHLLPVDKTKAEGTGYDIYPTHELGGEIHADHASLAKEIARHPRVVIDGYTGVFFDELRDDLNREFAKQGIEPLWWDASAALLPEERIDEMIAPFLGGDDPIFGYRTTLGLADFFDADKLAKIRPDETAPLNILIGAGAALAGWDAPVIYVDIPKNEIQFRARAGSVRNIGATKADDTKKMYKRFYFVDWVVLNRHKNEILSRIEIMVDGQRPNEITWARGEDVRRGLDRLARNAFRVRPWFEPGPWGGQWIKEHIPSLAQDVPNYAWSFELIVPENGIIFSHEGRMLEVSFDTIMYRAGEQVVGSRTFAKYAYEFPLRMDYLDTFDGGNLSIQCHPQTEYAIENFGEAMTQQETYYLLDAEPGAVVYLGFKEDIDPGKFRDALTESHRECTPLDVDRYVNSEVAEKHGLYLIPPGTLHSSGRGNLVLEISTTPYIFTFKMYDWLALGLDGQPRPLNIERAMENLCFDRKGEKVREELVSQPSLIESGDGWELWHLPTHRNHSYDVHRYVVADSVEVRTEGKCHVLNLVEGRSAEIHTAGGEVHELSYAETLVVPAAAGGYRIVNTDGKPAMVVKAFMK